jgi:GT2 family glycosyltransferase
MAWRYFLASSHEYFIIANNDVLVPDGVIDKLATALDPQGAQLLE